MMQAQKRWLPLALLLMGQIAAANPGGSIVVDAAGNVFYTTTAGVWKQAGTRGAPQLVGPGLHVHHLLVDSTGTLTGDHLWYTDARKRVPAGHYNWQYTAGAGIVRITDSITGIPREQSLIRDAAGNRFAIEFGIPSIIWQTDKNGNLTPLAQLSFAGLGTLHVTAKGVLLFANRDDVYALLPGDIPEKIAGAIGASNPVNGDSSGKILQLWTDNRRNIYVATGTVVKKIDHRRFVTSIYKSAPGWYPAAGYVSNIGDFWVLEYNAKNEARLQQIPMEVRQKIATESRSKMFGMLLLILAAVILLLYLLFRRKRSAGNF